MASTAARTISIHPTTVKGIVDDAEFSKITVGEGTFGVVTEYETAEGAREDFGAAGDRNVTGTPVSGPLGEIDFSPLFSPDDVILLASIYASGWVPLDSVAGHQVAIDGATYNGTTGVLDLTAASGGIPDQLLNGQAVELYLDSDNYFVVEMTKITNETWSLSPAPTEGSGTGELPATLTGGWKMISERARNEITEHRIDIKDGQSDLTGGAGAEYFPYCLFESGDWTFDPTDNVKFTPSFRGLYPEYKENGETYPGETLVTPTRYPTVVAGSFDLQLIIDGVNQAIGCAVSSLDITIARTVNGKRGVGVLGYCDLSASLLDITGNMSVAFKDMSYIKRSQENTPIGLFLIMPHSGVVAGEEIGYSQSYPRIFTTPSKSVADSDVQLDTEFTASHDPELGFAVQYCRFRRAV